MNPQPHPLPPHSAGRTAPHTPPPVDEQGNNRAGEKLRAMVGDRQEGKAEHGQRVPHFMETTSQNTETRGGGLRDSIS